MLILSSLYLSKCRFPVKKTSIFNFFFGGGTFWTPEKHPKTILREMPFWGVIGSIIKFNYCRNQPYSMTATNGPKECIYFPHHPPIGCLSQLNIFVREKMFPGVTFPPARKCFLPDMTVQKRLRFNIFLAGEKVSHEPSL